MFVVLLLHKGGRLCPMRYLLAPYLLFNFLAGVYLTFKHKAAEGRFASGRDFWLLLFLPVVGLGKWRYRQLQSQQTPHLFPERWYVYQHMIKLHKWFMGLFAIAPALGMLFSAIAISALTDVFKGSGSFYTMLLAFWADLGFILVFGILFTSLAFVLTLFYLLLIFLPKYLMRKTEAAYYKNQLPGSGHEGGGA